MADPVHIEVTDAYRDWYLDLDKKDAAAVDRKVKMLQLLGVALPFPHSSDKGGLSSCPMATSQRLSRERVGGWWKHTPTAFQSAYLDHRLPHEPSRFGRAAESNRVSWTLAQNVLVTPSFVSSSREILS